MSPDREGGRHNFRYFHTPGKVYLVFNPHRDKVILYNVFIAFIYEMNSIFGIFMES